MNRAAYGALIVALTSVAVGATTASSAEAKRCGAKSVHAVVAGKHVCLRSGHGCTGRFDKQYHRFGFHCHFGILEAFVWAPLRRPLRLPVVGPGELCPASTARHVHASWGAAVGDGPVYAVAGIAPGPAQVRLGSLPPRPGGYYVKTIWIGDPTVYTGPFLVRGRRLDAPGVVAFSDKETDAPGTEAQMSLPRDRESREARGPRYTRVPGAGCYGLQVDGRTFSFVVTFEAR